MSSPLQTTPHFNTQHAPIGAHASLTLGFPGARGGLDVERCLPPDQEMLIALESAEVPGLFEALPFISLVASGEAQRFVSDHSAATTRSTQLRCFDLDKVQRTFGLAIDSWRAGDLSFALYSPPADLPDPTVGEAPALMAMLAPAVRAVVTVDNRAGQSSRRLTLGFNRTDPYRGLRRIRTDDGLIGIGESAHAALFTNVRDAWTLTGMDWLEMFDEADPQSCPGSLGSFAMLGVEVPAGQIRTIHFAYCFYRGEQATTGLATHFYYTRWFNSIEAVGRFALSSFDECIARSEQVDSALKASSLSAEQQFIVAHATRSYLFSTQLLERDGEPVWVVNEGEYNMLNTMDLLPDHSLYEMQHHPWTLRNVLDLYVERYAYTDEVIPPGNKTPYPGGISFCHDMGVAGAFSTPGNSAYERPRLTGCFSYMSMEELLNWVLVAGLYNQASGDRAWLRGRHDVLKQCLESLAQRDHPDPALRTGVLRCDSSRCAGGREITTYDCLDPSLGQASDNAYLTGKFWAASVVLERLFNLLEDIESAQSAISQARLSAAAVVRAVRPDGLIPALLNGDSDAIVMPVVEGLAYAWFAGAADALALDGEFAEYLQALQRHVMDHALKDNGCLYPDGGWRITSSNANTFPAKIYVCQFVLKQILKLSVESASRRADRAHAAWMQHPVHSRWCWSEQVVDGEIHAARYYPRGVNSHVWLTSK